MPHTNFFRDLLKAAALLAAAALLPAQTAPPRSILGTVTEFHVDSLEIGVQPASGAAVFLKFGPETEVVRVPPGERDLNKAAPARVTEIALGDRVLVSFVAGMTEARRIVLISAGDIARRNEAERLDWRKRGISGVVASRNGEEITLEARTPAGVSTTTLTVTSKTIIRRYAPDSVKFADAQAGSLAEIATGDQVRARGSKSEDGTRATAEEIVYGTFLTKIGSITAVDREARVIRIQDLATSQPLTVRLTADSRLKLMPDFRSMFVTMMKAGGHGEGGPGAAPAERFDINQTLERLPPATIDDLKPGTAIVVTSTRGARSDGLTAIMLLANADSLIQMAQMQAGQGVSPMEAINRMHGGMFSGPGGISLPAMIP